MRLSLIKIGNSQGLRLPQALIKECAFGNVVDVHVRGKVMTIRAAEGARGQWNDYILAEQDKNPVGEKGEWIW